MREKIAWLEVMNQCKLNDIKKWLNTKPNFNKKQKEQARKIAQNLNLIAKGES